ncbi:hypothetical protein Cgig2_027972 [Carnegiea gigantea]|uniref:Uncharacterized protein n=1 Tax=Carnegiea gigantea TaxID=171969 RepID=A0A9Q1JUN3_9CARY|nr:hypothetical protein Cgig2_027972 [Carnegiea gigantea]
MKKSMKQPKEKQIPLSGKITHRSTQSDQIASTKSKIVGQTSDQCVNEVSQDMEPTNAKIIIHEDFDNRDNVQEVGDNIEGANAVESVDDSDGKMPIVTEIFKETHQQKSDTLDEESSNKLEEIITKSKENQPYSAFELLEDYFGPQDRDHVACFGYDDLENGHKREIKQLEDQMRFVVEMVMSTQPPLDTSRRGATSRSDHDQDD